MQTSTFSLMHRAQLASATATDGERVLHDVVVVRTGVAKGWGFSINQLFVQEFLAQCQEKGQLKAGFGHQYDRLGYQLGWWKNFRQRGEDEVIADLHILEAADESPFMPNAGKWVMKMATEAPEQLMTSIVFTIADFYTESAGDKMKISSWQRWEYDADKVFATLGEAQAADLVEEGAVTTAMFSTNMLSMPHLIEAQTETPSQRMSITDHLAAFFGLPKTDDKVVEMSAALSAAQQEAQARIAELQTAKEATDKELAELRASKEAADKELAELRAQPATAPATPEAAKADDLGTAPEGYAFSVEKEMGLDGLVHLTTNND